MSQNCNSRYKALVLKFSNDSFEREINSWFRDFVIAFLLLTNFDIYFEIPCVFILILIAESISKKTYKTSKYC